MYPALRLALALALATAAVAGPAMAADAVVGSGTPASCTEEAFDIALDTVQTSGGGTITFSCGDAHTILFNIPRTIISQVVIDGGDMITLSGNNATRIFNVVSGARLELRNINLSKGFSSGNGGAILSVGGSLSLANATFSGNRTADEGGSGGAIFSEGPITAVNSRFENNSGANGGAIDLRYGVGSFTSTTFKDNKTLSATNGWGGAILLWDGAKLTVRGGEFEGNSARRGGAIYNQFSNVEVVMEQGTLVRSNTAELGGGFWLRDGSTIIDKSVIAGNEANEGGGIFLYGGTLTVTDSTIAENKAAFGGGGVDVTNGVATLTGTTIAGNSVSAMFTPGGAIRLRSPINAQLILQNSTLSDNSSGHGGAIAASSGGGSMAIVLRYVTIAENLSSTGGVISISAENSDITLALTNAVLSGNSSPTCSISPSIATTATARFSLWSDDSCSFGTSEQNHSNTPAALGPLANNGGLTLTHAPLAGSPLIDNGTCLVGVATDQRGANRLHGPVCDIGAVEAGAAFPDGIFADSFQGTP